MEIDITVKLTNEGLLKYALLNGIIDLDEVSKKVDMNMIEKVNKIHPYAITSPTQKFTRWQTYIKDESKASKRRSVSDKTELGLYKKLADYYGVTDDPDVCTVQELFEKWIPYKRSVTSSENTIYRHIAHWNKYCKNTDVALMNIENISTTTLEIWANKIIKENNLTRKEWQNVKTIISGMFELACSDGEKLLIKNPWIGVKIKVKYRQVTKKSSESQVFTGDDYARLIDTCHQLYLKTNNEAYLAIEINSYFGLREGELVALEKSDVDFKHMQLHVHKEQVLERILQKDGHYKYEFKIVDHTKTYTDRYVPIIEKSKLLLENIINKHAGIEGEKGYLFLRDGHPLNTKQIDYALKHSCEVAGIPYRSSHKIRKTYASRLNAGGLPIDAIRELLGHTDAETTFKYLFNVYPKKETVNIIENSL